MRIFSKHTNKLKYTFYLFFVFMALLPCTVKGFALDFVDITYEKPVHPTKTTLEQQDCITAEQADAFAVEGNNQLKQLTPILIPTNEKKEIIEVAFTKQLLDVSSKFVKSLPKYILFQRLKIALV